MLSLLPLVFAAWFVGIVSFLNDVEGTQYSCSHAGGKCEFSVDDIMEGFDFTVTSDYKNVWPSPRDRFTTVALDSAISNGENVLLYIIKDNFSKRQFSNQFSNDDLKSMGLHQSIDEIVELIKTAKKQNENKISDKHLEENKSNLKISFNMGFGRTTQNATKPKTISQKYHSNDSLFVVINLSESWFKAEFAFSLTEDKRTEYEILNDRIDDIKAENVYLQWMMQKLVFSKHSLCQFKSIKQISSGNQPWDVMVFEDESLNITRQNQNQDIIISKSGFYNIIVRYGIQYQSNGNLHLTYRILLNAEPFAEQMVNGYTGGYIVFNEFIQLQNGDIINFYSSWANYLPPNREKMYNHFTIIKIG